MFHVISTVVSSVTVMYQIFIFDQEVKLDMNLGVRDGWMGLLLQQGCSVDGTQTVMLDSHLFQCLCCQLKISPFWGTSGN